MSSLYHIIYLFLSLQMFAFMLGAIFNKWDRCLPWPKLTLKFKWDVATYCTDICTRTDDHHHLLCCFCGIFVRSRLFKPTDNIHCDCICVFVFDFVFCYWYLESWRHQVLLYGSNSSFKRQQRYFFATDVEQSNFSYWWKVLQSSVSYEAMLDRSRAWRGKKFHKWPNVTN